MLELHIWGPAFGLPSVDSHCLAAIAYLQQAVPSDQWKVVASSNPTRSPTNELPALRIGTIWIGGFRNIFHYVTRFSAGQWVLDAGLQEQEAADCIAFSSFLESTAQPLLDLSLYVSTQNYITVTRPLYNTIQPFPLSYITPPVLRAVAKARTAHLGLSLDVDADSPVSSNPLIIPESLRRRNTSVSTLLASTPESAAEIRLDVLATDLFETIEQLRANKHFMVSCTNFTSLDCLVLGYLALMLYPQLPQPWLARTMRRKFPSLVAWVDEMRATVFGGQLSTEDALPWKKAECGGVLEVTRAFASTLLDQIPAARLWRRQDWMRRHGGMTTAVADEEWPIAAWGGTLAVASTAFMATGAMMVWTFRNWWLGGEGEGEGVVVEQVPSWDTFGEAGNLLGIYADHIDTERQMKGESISIPVLTDQEVDISAVDISAAVI